MVQADAFGIPIGQVLRVQSTEIRVKRRQRAEEKAAQVPVKIMIPVILFILPCLLDHGDGPGSHQHQGQLLMPLVTSVEVARFTPITTGARVIALLALAPPVAFTQSWPVILSLMLIAAVWMTATFASSISGLQLMPALVIETSLVTFFLTLSLNQSYLLVPALVIPQFVAGIHRGTRGAFESLGAEVVVLTATIASNASIHATTELLATLFTWLLAGLGFGLIGAVIRSAKLELGDTTRSSYRDARALLTQLLELSDDLVEGLDPISIGQHAVSIAREEIPLSGVLVHARTPDGSITLLDGESGVEPAMEWDEPGRPGLRPRASPSTAALPLPSPSRPTPAWSPSSPPDWRRASTPTTSASTRRWSRWHEPFVPPRSSSTPPWCSRR